MNVSDTDKPIQWKQYDAVIFDLDGVITRTARLHARAWKAMFDHHLKQRSDQKGTAFKPFDTETDYRKYLDGVPRYDGVKRFLASRGITLPYGTADDSPGQHTVCGLGNHKNMLFLKFLEDEGVHIYESSIALIRLLRKAGLRTAVVSSSKNCVPVLQAAGISELFDAKVDGTDAEELGLKGKPAPDIFLQAARHLNVTPDHAVVVEDAVAGVRAGRAGGFAIVIGVDREKQAQRLRDQGADLVVGDLSELSANLSQQPGLPPSALDHLEEITYPAGQQRLVIFLDYDGTLTPIVENPEQAQLVPSMRSILQVLAENYTVAIISGRDLLDIRQRVGVNKIYYAGSHGLDIMGPQQQRQAPRGAEAALPVLDKAESELQHLLQDIDGTFIERKRFSVAVHYRQVDEARAPEVEQAVNTVLEKYPDLRKGYGKKVYELLPDIHWDKGAALNWLLQALGLRGGDVLPLYIGDDITDEDAFAAVNNTGIGIVVMDEYRATRADYRLNNVDEVAHFLQALIRHAEMQR